MVKAVLTLGTLENEALDRIMALGRSQGAVGKSAIRAVARAVASDDYATLLTLALEYPELGNKRTRAKGRKVSPAQLIRANLITHLSRRMSEHLKLLAENGHLPWLNE